MKVEILNAVNPASQQIFEHVESTPKTNFQKWLKRQLRLKRNGRH